jgi:ligand-binding SRPBCC domain-containing protein
MVHTLRRSQFLPVPVEQVWEYFCDPHNLNALTPPDMNFRILTAPLPRMYQGQLIAYRVQFIRGVSSFWLTEIAHVREQEYFVDEQRQGPYAFWYHEHAFCAENGGTRMLDTVTYDVGFGVLGWALNALWIGARLRYIFDYRARRIAEIFGAEMPA